MQIFINEAITNGIIAYIDKNNNGTYAKAHIFELRIIEFLIKLYGKTDILNPYTIRSEDSFKNNLMVYGATSEEINKLISLLKEYNNWLNSTTREKSTLIKELFNILSGLVILKNNSVVISSEEMKFYEDFFALKDSKINQIVQMISLSREDVLNVWPLRVAKSKEEPIVEEPIFLEDKEYEKYGLLMNEVKELPKEQVKKLNEEIKNRDEEGNNNDGGKTKPWQLVLTSGNGYVDALVLFSIMCTELMIGVIVTIVIGRL